MQDYNLPEAEPVPIANLLIDSPGENALKKNTDHFVKRGRTEKVCDTCAITALYTLQANAPSGGAGHRTSMRGGGPLTTLLIPQDAMKQALWYKLWINVIPDFKAENAGSIKNENLNKVYPWVTNTLTSEKGSKTEKVLLKDGHAYQVYWSMPRRIRLDYQTRVAGCCDICGQESAALFTQYRSKNYGTSYAETWRHPLSPYTANTIDKPGLAIKGQPGGVCYRHWLTLNVNNDKTQTAEVVNSISKSARHFLLKQGLRLWAYGYDMDNMKARCWYQAIMPTYDINPDIQRQFTEEVSIFIQAAEEAAKILRAQLKDAWRSESGDFSHITTDFYHRTEKEFYVLLSELLHAFEKSMSIGKYKQQWGKTLKRQAEALFETWAMTGDCYKPDDMQRIFTARANLGRFLHGKLKHLLTAKVGA